MTFGTIGFIAGSVYTSSSNNQGSLLNPSKHAMQPMMQPSKTSGTCLDTCSLAKNGICDDGSEDVLAALAKEKGPANIRRFVSVGCDLGTDCTDCGPGAQKIPHSWARGDGPISLLRSSSVEVRVRSIMPLKDVKFKFAYTDPHKDTDVSQNMQTYGIVEAEISEIFVAVLKNRCLRPDGSPALFLDVGANFGWYSILAASMGCRVLAFEPVPQFRAFLEYNVHLNGLGNLVQITPNVVSNVSGASLTLIVPSNGIWGTAGIDGLNIDKNVQGSHQKITTTSMTVTDAVKEDVLLMKVDVEGFEWSVMKGAAGLLSSYNVENIIMEYSPGVFERVMNFEGIISTITMLIDLIKVGFKIGHVGEGKGFLEDLSSGPLSRNEKVFEEVSHHNLLYDVRDSQLYSEAKLGCPVAEELRAKYHWPCMSVPEDLNPRSFRSIFGHNTNVWASKNLSLLKLAGTVGMTDLDTPATEWNLTKKSTKPGDIRSTVFKESLIGMGMRPCFAIDAKYQIHHRCHCLNAKVCGEESQLVARLLQERQMPSNYVLPPP